MRPRAIQRRTLGHRLLVANAHARRVIVKRDGQRVVRRRALVRIHDAVLQIQRRRVLRVIARRHTIQRRVQHVLQQRHLVGTRGLVRDLHLKQRTRAACRAGRDRGRQRVRRSIPAVRHRLLAHRRCRACQRRKREAVRTRSVIAHAATERTRERRQSRTHFACSALRVVTRQAIVVHRCCRRVVVRRRVHIHDLEAEACAGRIVIAIRHRERARHRGYRAQRHRIGLELI